MTLSTTLERFFFIYKTLERNLLGENVNAMKLFPNALQKFLIPYLVVLVAITIPIFGDTMLSWIPFLVAQRQQASSQEPSTSGGGLSINRSSDRSIDEPITRTL